MTDANRDKLCGGETWKVKSVTLKDPNKGIGLKQGDKLRLVEKRNLVLLETKGKMRTRGDWEPLDIRLKEDTGGGHRPGTLKGDVRIKNKKLSQMELHNIYINLDDQDPSKVLIDVVDPEEQTAAERLHGGIAHGEN